MKKLRKDLTPNKSTLYRIFDKLKEKKSRFRDGVKNSITYYEIKSNHHHHHFLCELCDNVYCLTSCHSDTLTFDIEELVPNKTSTSIITSLHFMDSVICVDNRIILNHLKIIRQNLKNKQYAKTHYSVTTMIKSFSIFFISASYSG